MADITEKVTQEYDASQIQVLEGLEAVRKRPGMYIGSTSSSGLHHLVYEIVDNSIDEALAGFCTHIEVSIEEGDIIRVSDNGRGIPVDTQEQTGKSALEVVFTVLHAGGKFGGGGYKVSGGLHGVGASVVNALSEWLEVRVHKDGKIHEMKFSRGDITQPITVVGETERTGTEVRFKPDPEMFDDTVYDYEILHTRMREQAFLNGGLTITLEDKRPGQEKSETMCYEGGIREFVRYLNKHKNPIHEEVIYLSGAKGDAIAEIALQYNDGYNETLVSFANDIHTPEGGMHETGFKTALTRVINAYGQKNNIIKGDDKVSGEDVREGISAVISVKLPEAQFEGQTKQKLGNAYIRTLVDGIMNEQLSVYFEEHPQVAKAILEKAMMANRAREAARKARESVRRKTGLESGQMPDKLQDCNERDPSLCEIYIVEGDSAAGSAIQGRDSRFQAILAMWGKMLNVEKARADKIYGNDKLYPLIVALAHLLLPLHAPPHRKRLRLLRGAAPLQAAAGQTAAGGLFRRAAGPDQRGDAWREPQREDRHLPLQRSGRDGPPRAVGDHHGPGKALPAPHHPERPGRPGLHRAHGRRGGAPPGLDRAECQVCGEFGYLIPLCLP